MLAAVAAITSLTRCFSLRGLVPLHNACSYGHLEVAELLVLHGAVVNVADLWKFTPLHEAAAKGKYDICKLLLQVHTHTHKHTQIRVRLGSGDRILSRPARC